MPRASFGHVLCALFYGSQLCQNLQVSTCKTLFLRLWVSPECHPAFTSSLTTWDCIARTGDLQQRWTRVLSHQTPRFISSIALLLISCPFREPAALTQETCRNVEGFKELDVPRVSKLQTNVGVSGQIPISILQRDPQSYPCAR